MKQPKPTVEVDELGVLLAQIAPLARREKELKDKLKAYGKPVLEGALFRCTVTDALQERIDGALIKSEMGDAWYAEHTKVIAVTTVKCSAKTAGI